MCEGKGFWQNWKYENYRFDVMVAGLLGFGLGNLFAYALFRICAELQGV